MVHKRIFVVSIQPLQLRAMSLQLLNYLILLQLLNYFYYLHSIVSSAAPPAMDVNNFHVKVHGSKLN